MTAKSIFLESRSSPPIELSWAIGLRRLVWIVISVATICILFAGIIEKAEEYGSPLPKFFVPTFVTIIHLSYLYLVFWLLIFSHPPDDLHLQRMIYPFLLFLAYLLYASSAYAKYINTYPQFTPQLALLLGINVKTPQSLLIRSYWLFFFLYLAWFLRDCFEWNESHNYKRRWQIIFWWAAEMLSLGILLGRISIEKSWYNMDNRISWLFDKNYAIGISLFLWLILAGFERLWKQGSYKNIYTLYIDRNMILDETKIELPPISWNRVSTILDYGCGDGKRLLQNIKWLNFQNSGKSNDQITIVGYDRDESWASIFNQNISNAGFKSSFVTDESNLVNYKFDFINLTHILYEPKTVKQIARFLKQVSSSNGVYVIVRGAAPQSFFTIVSMANSLRLFSPTKSHLWYFALDNIVHKNNLKRVDASKIGITPDAIVNQKYPLDAVGIDFATDLLQYLYRGTSGERSKYYLDVLKNISGLSYIPNDDLIYVYEVKAN